MKKFILALDQGTTSSRAIVFDHDGNAVATAQKEHKQSYPQPGWVEHDPEEIWQNQHVVAFEALQQAGLAAQDIAAIGITNQRETTVVWDRHTGAPIHPAIVWQDRRTADACEALKRAGHEPVVIERTGLRLDPYFSGTKLRWILDNVPGARDKATAGDLAFGTIDTWLLWKLTQGKAHATDATNASRTLLLNLRQGCWDDEMLALLDIPRAMLPELRDSSGEFGIVSGSSPLAGIPVTGIAGDQQAALFGQACHQPGMAKNTYGTGCFLLMHTGTEAPVSKHNLLTTVALRFNGKLEYALEGSVFIAGAVIQWLRDELQLIRTASECDEAAATVPDSNGVFLVPAFAGLGAPHWDPFARGAIFGLTRGANRAHLCRAALESIALQSAELIEAMAKDSGITLQELRVDGGASRSALLMQIQADVLSKPVVRPRCIETTALGAAYLAGLAVGFWASREDIAHHWIEDARFTPQHDLSDLKRGWDEAVKRSKGWIAC
ncbi:MAG: glycerol kinase [Verrucomicrobiaceae bacterium]|nr:glycerol kinase [Verrucomicrobiaceae bacterium]